MGADNQFAGSIPELYERLLVPLIFRQYATDLAARATALKPRQVLELAAGTGVVTRELARSLPADSRIIATDLNQPMLDQAARLGTARTVQWQQADAQALPFADASADLVVCQFGVMFFPDKPRAYAEARRVLRPGGRLLFNVWSRLAENEFPDTVMTALTALFAADPPQFMARVPHGYFDEQGIRADLREGGFTNAPELTWLDGRSNAEGAAPVAEAFCQGTPMRNELEARGPGALASATAAAEQALRARFGTGAISGKIRALVVSVAA